MNAQHLASTGEWYTNPECVGAIVDVIGPIQYDPCSCVKAQSIVKAETYHTALDYPLRRIWSLVGSNAIVNPPGCCEVVEGPKGDYYRECRNYGRCSCVYPARFLRKSVLEARDGCMDIIYVAYSVNQLRQIPRKLVSDGLVLTMAIPEERIPYIDSRTMKPQKGTNCDSAFLCLSREESIHSLFSERFRVMKCAIYRMESGC